MSILEEKLYATTAPVPYKEWVRYNNLSSYDKQTYNNYTLYVEEWYRVNYNSTDQNQVDSVKQSYINLLKELATYYKDQDDNLFIKDIDFNSDEEIIYSIPYFVQRLKDLAIDIAGKREELKKAKSKHSTIGSNKNLTFTIRDHLLKNHTNTTKTFSISSLKDIFPEFASVKSTLSLEIEDLDDRGSYGDNSEESNIIPRLADNPLFSLYASYLADIESSNIPLSGYEAYNINSNSNIDNIISLNKNQLGTDLYYISAAAVNSDSPDSSTNIPISLGNNWFYWPGGEVYTDISSTQNIYKPIHINSSVLTLTSTGSTASDSYSAADLFFIESDGHIEGAWLKGNMYKALSEEMIVTATPSTIRSFIFPTPGFSIDDRLKYKGRSFDDKGLKTYNSLDPQIRENIYTQYIAKDSVSGKLEKDIYINQTTLVNSGATAGTTSLQSDLITIRPSGPYNDAAQNISTGSYNDTNNTKVAMLYSLSSTEIAVSDTIGQQAEVLWPYTTYNKGEDIYMSSIDDACTPISIQNINISKHMLGAVASATPESSDVIYKLSSKDGEIVDAAWLKTGSVKDLATTNDYSISVYSTSAINCVEILDGPVQSNLFLNAAPGNKISFIWCDIDTPADEVFNYKEHSQDCPYERDYNYSINHSPSGAPWSKCTCKALHYSPLGHNGVNYTDNNANADTLFADPQNLGSSFNVSVWKDTRGFNYRTSPQFAHFRALNSSKNFIGWSKGTWQTGNGNRFILKTGRRYTYIRGGIRGYTSTVSVPNMISYYPFKKVIGSTSNQTPSDIVFALDISGSQYLTYKRSIQLIASCIDNINTDNGSQISVLIFNEKANVLSYLNKDKQAIKRALNSLILTDPLSPTNILDAIEVTNKIFTEARGGTERSLGGIGSNIDIIVSTGAEAIQSFNIPKEDNNKILILLSDGDFKQQTNEAISTLKKYSYIKTVCVDIGPNSSYNNTMERVASVGGSYINYENILKQTDYIEHVTNVANAITSSIFNNATIQPVWYKAIYNSSTDTISDAGEISNLTINSGDFLRIRRTRSTPTYNTQDNQSSFSIKVLPLIIDVPLFGWNYNTRSFDGVSRGAKPYWGKVYNELDTNNNFTKYAREFGGHIRYFNEFIPISHPEVSDLQLTYGGYVEYRNRGCNILRWKQQIEYSTIDTTKTWCSLKVCNQKFNLKDIFKHIDVDKIFEQTDEPSNIQLSTYTSQSPAYYCYYSRSESSFNIEQPLYLLSKTTDTTFSVAASGILVKPSYPYRNLSNIFNVSIPTKVDTSALVSHSQISRYLLPHKLGVPYILGKGHINTLSKDRLKSLQLQSDDPLVFGDPILYTSNRGLSREDQKSPYITTYVDNTWLKEGIQSKGAAGNITDSSKYQKFVPYQSDYETYGNSLHGLSRQQDSMMFWSGPRSNIWNDEEGYPSNFKKEVSPDSIAQRTQELLINNKTQAVWRTDIYGNNFSIYKDFTSPAPAQSMNTRRESYGEIWIRTAADKIHSDKVAFKDIYSKYISKTAFYSDLQNNHIQSLEIYGNVIIIKTPNGVLIEKYNYDYDTDTFSSISNSRSFIDISTGLLYAGHWYFEEENNIQFFTIQWLSAFNRLRVNGYKYDIDIDVFNINHESELSTSNRDNTYSFDIIRQPILPTYNKTTRNIIIPFISKDLADNKEFLFQANFSRTKLSITAEAFFVVNLN